MTGSLPRPLAELPFAALRPVVGVMTDIDDTLTRDGAIEPAALSALNDLALAGVPVVAITGRPLGWSEAFARAWPVDAIAAENGGAAWVRQGGAVQAEYAQDEPTRAALTLKLRAVAAQIVREVPGACLARDSAGRVTDIAIDHAEYTALPEAAIAQVLALMQAAGMNATVSSIHVNGWFGTHDKWSAAVWMVRRLYGRDLHAEVDRWIYVGDSTNDQLMFGRFPLAVGVANLMHFAQALHTWPAYITQAERGLGFAEVAARLLSAHG
jgi:HAD superfamily hydrolase (TIGR01484 family)